MKDLNYLRLQKVHIQKILKTFLIIVIPSFSCYVPPPTACHEKNCSTEQKSLAEHKDPEQIREEVPLEVPPKDATGQDAASVQESNSDSPEPNQCSLECKSPEDCSSTSCPYCVILSSGKSLCSQTRSCGMMCTTQKDCPGDCSRCHNKRCVKAVGCGSKCEKDSDCAQNCSHCRKIFGTRRCSV